jgi:endonuclease/exonuclease/phosphatase family metal-dependent hydrolase
MSSGSKLRVMTFNIRCDSGSSHEQRWDVRGPFIAEVIRAAAPDLLGTQEVLPNQWDTLRSTLPEYDVAGVGREDGRRKGEAAAIYYRRDRFEKLDGGDFWLSETPEVVGSKGWDADYWMRICTWVRLRDKADGRPILWFNTHFDHSGPIARLESAKLVRQRLGEYAKPDDDLLVTGDFNCGQASPPYAALVDGEPPRLIDAYRAVHPAGVDGPEDGTFHGFNGNHDGERIDWVLMSHRWKATSARIDRTARDGRLPSDHFPVVVDLER